LGDGAFVGWRLDPDVYRASWDSGIGAARSGGRWNSAGVRAVYAALDPATAILEVAVHVGFDDLDRVKRVLTSFVVDSPAAVLVIEPDQVPNPNWLRPGRPTTNQQRFGDSVLGEHGIMVIPSTVSSHSWNLVFLAGLAVPKHRLQAQEPFALDPRLAS
jgi:RES domain-containing protein